MQVLTADNFTAKLTNQFQGLETFNTIGCQITFHLTLKITSAQVVKTNNSHFQDYLYLDDHT